MLSRTIGIDEAFAQGEGELTTAGQVVALSEGELDGFNVQLYRLHRGPPALGLRQGASVIASVLWPYPIEENSANW